LTLIPYQTAQTTWKSLHSIHSFQTLDSVANSTSLIRLWRFITVLLAYLLTYQCASVPRVIILRYNGHSPIYLFL